MDLGTREIKKKGRSGKEDRDINNKREQGRFRRGGKTLSRTKTAMQTYRGAHH